MNFKGSLSVVDNTDWLKTVAIILVAVDHFGYFFIDNADWWSVFGRLAAPPFFFLMGYARTRTVPLYWIWLAVFLTLLDSWNAGWTWVAPNILLSFVLIRTVHPHVLTQIQHHGWTALVIFVSVLLAVLPIAAEIVDYGAEGWLWALLGLLQRMYVDGKSVDELGGTAQPTTHAIAGSVGLMRLLTCFVAAVVYVWQEQMEFSFSQVHFAVFIVSIAVLSLSLCLFRRGTSRIQPPESISGTLCFIGRRTLEIYVIQLAGSELITMLWPDLAA